MGTKCLPSSFCGVRQTKAAGGEERCMHWATIAPIWVIGEPISIEADVFTDGHEMLAVELLWRAADEGDWRRVQMHALANDCWRGTIAPERIGRYEFTVEAWWDRFGTFSRDLAVKHKARVDVSVELVEGRKLLEDAKQRTRSGDSK